MSKPPQRRQNGKKRPARKSAAGTANTGGRRRRLVYTLAVIGVWGAIALVAAGLYFAHDMPRVSDLAPTPAEPSIVVLARDGSTIATYGDVHGEWLRFDEFPDVLLGALIATEDRRFFSHVGFDPVGLGRAALRNLVHRRIVEGGSTITQQLAKNLFLSSERTYRRKVQEVMISLWLELNLSKEEILTLYLNRMFFGSRSYGVDAAAHTYFGHGARSLSLGEAAMLVGLLKAPSELAPNRNYEGALGRSHEVLEAMRDIGAITAEDVEFARDHPPRVVRPMTGIDSRYFADWVVARIPASVTARGLPLVVETTLDPTAQAVVERALRRTLNTDGIPGNIGQGAVLVMTVDGSVRAMAGGRSYAESQFNRAVQARRQPGSAFKTIVYLAALDAGISPDSTMRDSPVRMDGWSPENFTGTYVGPVTLRHAFAQSINTVSVKLSERADRRRVIRVARALGIASPLTPHPSLALGTSEVTLLELTTAYGVIANSGYDVTPDPIVEIRSATGDVLYRRLPRVSAAVIDPVANDVMRELLAEAVASGTGRNAVFGGPAAGKTGTSQDFRDAWFVGFSGDLVTGVWLGNDDGAAMNRVTGGGAPARLWSSIMQGLANGLVVEPVGAPKRRPTSPADPAESQPDNLFDRLRERLGLDG